MLKQEVRALSSRYVDGTLMYYGKHLFTWAKAYGMPWVLVSIEPIV